jgi:uncharacterized membrane protein YphA (DoxX/SURF4 family)
MRLLLNASRILLAIVFIFSGFVKAVDPMGGAIKIEDYFNAFGLSGFNSLSFVLSVVLALAEFLAGFLLLFKVWSRLSSLAVFIFMCIFTPLTLYIAIFNPVSDCGCFGDAVKLTNWETFFKDLALLPLSYWVFRKSNQFATGTGMVRQTLTAVWGVAIILFVVIWAQLYEPIIDFRPYRIGTDIRKGMEIPANAAQPEYETTFILEKNGVKQEFTVDNYPYTDSTWVFVDSKTRVLSEGYQPPIKDFVLQNGDGDNLAGKILESESPVFLVVAPKIGDLSSKEVSRLLELWHTCMQSSYSMFVLTSTVQETVEQFDIREQAGFRYLWGDETMLKTICRSNPGIIIIQNGVISGKYTLNNLPPMAELNKPLSASFSALRRSNMIFLVLTLIFASLFFEKITYRTSKH